MELVNTRLCYELGSKAKLEHLNAAITVYIFTILTYRKNLIEF